MFISNFGPTSSTQPQSRLLGESDDVVVYIFPNGNACVKQKIPVPMHFPQTGSQMAPSAGPLKRLGERLIEAGLISPVQRDVALHDQQVTGARFGEILVARGWLQESMIEAFVQPCALK